MFRDNLARFFAVAAGVVFFAGLAGAQTKVAVVDMQQAVLNTAEVKKGVSELEAKFKPRQATLEQLRNDISNIQQQLQSGKLTPQQSSELQAQGTRKQREYERMAQDSQEELEAERNDLFGRNGQRMRDVVRKLAEERGVDVVVDVSQTIYAKPALDLTKDAIAAFDKAYPPAATSAAK
jgi:outer membrane protein